MKDIPSASEIKKIMIEALLKECKCSIPYKKIRVMGDAVYAMLAERERKGVE